MGHESNLLVVRIDEREVPLRIHDGQWQARESCTRANVRNRVTLKRGLHGQAVEEMMRDHLSAPGNRREVIGLVPASQLVYQLQQRVGRSLRQLNAERACGFD